MACNTKSDAIPLNKTHNQIVQKLRACWSYSPVASAVYQWLVNCIICGNATWPTLLTESAHVYGVDALPAWEIHTIGELAPHEREVVYNMFIRDIIY